MSSGTGSTPTSADLLTLLSASVSALESVETTLLCSATTATGASLSKRLALISDLAGRLQDGAAWEPWEEQAYQAGTFATLVGLRARVECLPVMPETWEEYEAETVRAPPAEPPAGGEPQPV